MKTQRSWTLVATLALVIAAGASALAQNSAAGSRGVTNSAMVEAYERGDRVAIVAAVGDYNGDLESLRFTVADAMKLSEVLKSQGYIVFTLIDREATTANIRARLASLSKSKPGTLLFAFAGHGFQSAAGTNFLATYGTTVETLETRGASLKDIEALMKATGAQRSVLIIDACRNVPGSRSAAKSGSFSDRDFATSEGVRILLSTRPGGFSYEDPKLQHGLFTYFVIEGLRGKAANQDNHVSFDDLATYVERSVRGYAAGLNLEQTPFRSGEGSGEFLLSMPAPAQAAAAGAAAPVAERPAAAPPQKAAAAAAQGPLPLPPSAEMTAFTNRLQLYQQYAKVITTQLNTLRERMRAQQLDLRPDMAIAETQMVQALRDAQTAASSGQAQAAGQHLDTAKAAIQKLGKFLNINVEAL